MLCAGHVPIPFGRGSACGTSAGLHSFRYLQPIQTFARLQRAAPYGLRRLRTSSRAIRHTDRTTPCHNHNKEHRTLPRAARQDRFLLRLGPRGEDLLARLLQMDAVGVPADVQLVLLQQAPEGYAYREAHRALRDQRYAERRRRRYKSGLLRGDELHCRRMELMGRG